MRRFRMDRRVSSRRVPRVIPLALVLAAGSCGDPGGSGAPGAVASSAHLPGGYAVRLDRQNRDVADFVATINDGSLQVHTGPAGIVYRPAQVVDAESYAVRARFSEVGAPEGHREGFGLFIGGQDLEGTNQRYTYFLVRGDGRYLIRHREGRRHPGDLERMAVVRGSADCHHGGRRRQRARHCRRRSGAALLLQ